MVYPVAVVQNRGAVTIYNVNIELHRDSVDGPLLKAEVIAEIAPKETVAVSSELDVSGEPTGQFEVFTVVDPGGSVLESKEDNNEKSVQVFVAPDLVIWSGDVELVPNGSGAEVMVTVRNWGTFDAVDVTVEAYDDVTGDSILYSGQIALIPVDGEVTITLAAPSTVTQVYAVADSNELIQEIKKDNNAGAFLTAGE